MAKISLVSFVYNEAENMREFMENVAPHMDEVLIVDMDSTDQTLEIAYEYTKKIFRKPHLICGDSYKEFLVNRAKGDWVLWAYPDERFNPKFLQEMHKLAESTSHDAYAIMRHEYRDGVRLMPHGTTQSPNYQNRLHRKCDNIFYTDLVHAELHGHYRVCPLPDDYFMEHRKKDVEQEFDNWRTYVEMKHLLWKYRESQIEPYKTYCNSYRQIVKDSEAKNADGSRVRHPAEEIWWRWWDFKNNARGSVSEIELKRLMGINTTPVSV
jgi:glycosyltransferase involved in cell wall biosynthesis